MVIKSAGREAFVTYAEVKYFSFIENIFHEGHMVVLFNGTTE